MYTVSVLQVLCTGLLFSLGWPPCHLFSQGWFLFFRSWLEYQVGTAQCRWGPLSLTPSLRRCARLYLFLVCVPLCSSSIFPGVSSPTGSFSLMPGTRWSHIVECTEWKTVVFPLQKHLEFGYWTYLEAFISSLLLLESLIAFLVKKKITWTFKKMIGGWIKKR